MPSCGSTWSATSAFAVFLRLPGRKLEGAGLQESLLPFIGNLNELGAFTSWDQPPRNKN